MTCSSRCDVFDGYSFPRVALRSASTPYNGHGTSEDAFQDDPRSRLFMKLLRHRHTAVMWWNNPIRNSQICRTALLSLVALSLLLQTRTLLPYWQSSTDPLNDHYHYDDDASCRPPVAQGLIDWIDLEENVTKKKQLKLLTNIPSVHQIPVDYDVDPLLRADDDSDYASLSVQDFQFSILFKTASSVPLSQYAIDQSWEEVSRSSIVTSRKGAIFFDAIYCRIHDQRVWFLYHFPHFLQRFFPCWSILHAFLEQEPSFSFSGSKKNASHAARLYIVLPETYEVRVGSYVDSLLQHITFSGDARGPPSTPTVSIVQGNATLLPQDTLRLLIECTHTEGGWGPPVKYFMSSQPAAAASSYFYGVPQLQRLILGAPPVEPDIGRNVALLQILILDRIESTRTIVYVSEIQKILEEAAFTIEQDPKCETAQIVFVSDGNYPTNKKLVRFNVTYIPSFTGWTVRDQARAMHQADIILSPHGAQLANAIYIRPCTVVLEFFPYAYFVPFFPSLVRSAAGTPFVAYPKCYDRYADRNRTMQYASYRVRVRSIPMFISPQSIVKNLRPLVHSYIQCRCERGKLGHK